MKESDTMDNNMLVLGIETSCDETAAAVVLNGREVLSNVVSSQVEVHKKFGGVVPEIASRKHIENISYIIDEALKNANVFIDDINLVGVTYGPGLVGALLVGLSTAKALAYSADIPFIGVHHIIGHICANYIEHKNLKPPFICLIVSGGHSHIIEVKDYNTFNILGRTRDDAAGEAFDKIARVLGLGYPGGPAIDKISKDGKSNSVQFPRVYFDDNSYDFSFSGIKTSVINHINMLNQKNEKINKSDIAASFQQAVIEVLVNNSIRAVKDYSYNKLVLAGGVAANSLLRKQLLEKANKKGINLYYPSLKLCTDNAAMIASAAYYRYLDKGESQINLNAYPSLSIEEY